MFATFIAYVLSAVIALHAGSTRSRSVSILCVCVGQIGVKSFLRSSRSDRRRSLRWNAKKRAYSMSWRCRAARCSFPELPAALDCRRVEKRRRSSWPEPEVTSSHVFCARSRNKLLRANLSASGNWRSNFKRRHFRCGRVRSGCAQKLPWEA